MSLNQKLSKLRSDGYITDDEYQMLKQKPKTGHWIYDKSIANWICSQCGETPKTMGYVGTDTFMAEHFKYCNHCGARMAESED